MALFIDSLIQFLVNASDSLADTVTVLKLSFSEILTKWQRFFSFLAAQQGNQDLGLPEQKLEVQQLQVNE